MPASPKIDSLIQGVSRRGFLVNSVGIFAGACAMARGASVAAAVRGRTIAESAAASLASLAPLDIRIADGRILLTSKAADPITSALPKLWWRAAGETAWRESSGTDFQELAGKPGQRRFRVALGPLVADVAMGRFIGDRVWKISGVLSNTGVTAVELARFNYLNGRLAGTRFLELNGGREQPTLREGRASTALRADIEAFWEGMGVTWPRFADPVVDEKGWFASLDYAAFVKGWNQPGWGFGFVAPGNAFGEIGYRGDGGSADMYAAVQLDGITLGAGAHLTLEETLVWCGDLQSGLDLWVRTCAAELQARKPPPPMVGYCSWYQLYSEVREQDIERGVREFQHWPVPPGGRLIQVDTGWQTALGDWTPNSKFEHWGSLPARIAATGSIPALWIAPLMVGADHSIVKRHPDWLQRLPDGTPAITFPDDALDDEKGAKIHFLDPDHPAVQAFIADTFRRLKSEGWRYFEIDFTYAVTGARYAPGRTKTGFQSQRELYQRIRAALGPDAIINACIGAAGRYVIGSADVARTGGDISFDFPHVKDSVHQNLSRFATNGHWFQADADHFSMRSSKSQLDPEERRLLTGTIGLSGGIFLTSDYPSQWSLEDAAFVRQFWNEQGPRVPDEQYVAWTPDGEIIAYRVSHRDGPRALHRVALYNWTGKPVTTSVALEAVQLAPRVRLTAAAGSAGYRLNGGIIRVIAQPAHSMRIVDLTES